MMDLLPRIYAHDRVFSLVAKKIHTSDPLEALWRQLAKVLEKLRVDGGFLFLIARGWSQLVLLNSRSDALGDIGPRMIFIVYHGGSSKKGILCWFYPGDYRDNANSDDFFFKFAVGIGRVVGIAVGDGKVVGVTST
uniref:Uncharacterized protein n=1 Tax=Cannabis sativa TaxID=3483 RepID=A0A803QKH5_CANSA